MFTVMVYVNVLGGYYFPAKEDGEWILPDYNRGDEYTTEEVNEIINYLTRKYEKFRVELIRM